MSWTDDRVSLLKKLWSEGKTAAEIAGELGGVTRNAVIGKAHRLKLSSRVSPIQQNKKKTAKPEADSVPVKKEKPAAKSNKTAAAAPKTRPAEEVAIIQKGDGVHMAELKERMCRWPIGDPRDAEFRFCGCKVHSGLPYCAEHAKMAYQAATRQRVLKENEFDGIDKDVKKAMAG